MEKRASSVSFTMTAVIDGENAVHLALDNEHEDFIYDDAGSNKSGSATSQARLYDGPAEKTADVTEWRISANGGTSWGSSVGTNSGDTATASISAAGLLTVSGLKAATGKVKVRAQYDGKYYYAEFTGNKTSQDKYDLVVKPNAIAFNSSDAWANKTITLSAQRTDIQGNKTQVPITGRAADAIQAYYSFVRGDGTMVTDDLNRMTSGSFTLAESDAKNYAGIYFELRLYSGSAYRMCDYETVEIAKTENGADGTSPWIADLSNEMDSVACDLSGKPTAAKSLTTTIALFYGQTAKGFGTPTVKRNGTALTVNASSYTNGVKVSYNNKVLTVAYNTSATISDVDEFEITITASDDPTVVRTLTFSVLGARPGANGEAATTYQLVPSVSEIVRHKDGTYSPTSLTCYCTSLKTDTATDNPSEATMQYSYNNSRWTDFTASTSFYASTIYSSGKKLYLRLLVGTKVIDKESIPIVEDGADGVVYLLRCSTSEVYFQNDGQGGVTASPATYTLNIVRISGSQETVLSTAPNGYSVEFKEGDAIWTDDQPLGTLNASSELLDGSASKLSYGLFKGSQLLQEVTVLSKWPVPGDKGDDGYGLTLTPQSLIFEEKLDSDGESTSIDYTNNTVTAVVYKSKTPLTTTVTEKTTSGTYSNCILSNIITSGGTVTMGSGSISLASDASAGFFTVNIQADNGAYNRDVRINFYVNRLGSFTRTINGAIETAKGQMTTYTDNKASAAEQNAKDYADGLDSVVRNDYAVAIQTSAQGLTQEFTEQISRAGADGRNLFGFSNGIVFANATPFIQGYGLVGRPWLNTTDKTARIYNLGMYGRLGYYTVSCQVRTSASAGYVRLQMNWHEATSGTQAASGGLKGVVNATPGTWQDLTATFLFDDAAEDHIGTSLQPGEAGSYSVGDINGYIDIGQIDSGISETRISVSDNLIYVRHLKIEYRDSASDFCESDEDIAAIGQGNLATATPADFYASGPAGDRQHQDTNTYDGVTVSDVYLLSYNNSASDYTDTWSQWLTYPLALRQLKAGQIYTLSFWARSTVAGLKMMSTLRLSTVNTTPYNNNGSMISPEADAVYIGRNGSIIESVRSRGDTKVLLTTAWRQYFVRYYVDTDCYLYELVAATIYGDDNLGKNCTVYIGNVQLQEGYVMSPSSFSSLIEQNARRISLVQQSGTKRAGIDIQNGTVNLFGDRVTFSNADGTIKDKVWIDPEEGTMHAVNGEFSGTVKASNLYHGVCVIGEESWGYCTQDWIDDFSDERWIGNFSIGSYYTKEQARLLSGGSVGIDSMLRCTYAADIVIAPNLYNNSTTRYVTLPAAKDFPGKLVEVIDCAYTNGQAIGDIIVGAADDGYFGLGINISDVAYAGSSVNIGSGGKTRFYSLYKESRWWWLKLI